MFTVKTFLSLLLGAVTAQIGENHLPHLQKNSTVQDRVSLILLFKHKSSYFLKKVFTLFQVQWTNEALESSPEFLSSSAAGREFLSSSAKGRGYNVTCGPACTYPLLGVGALLVYSFLAGESPSRSSKDEKLTSERGSQLVKQSEVSDPFWIEEEVDLRDKIRTEFGRAARRKMRREREAQKRRLQNLKIGEKV